MTSPTSAGPSAIPPAPRSRLHWSVAAPLTAAVGVGSAVLGILADLPLLGLAGAVVAAVPAVLASRQVPTLQAEAARYRAEAARATAAVLAPRATVPDPRATVVVEAAPVRAFVRPRAVPSQLDLTGAEGPAGSAPGRPVVDLVKQPAPASEPQHATMGAIGAASGSGDGTARATAHARVDTAELQLIWDLGEAPRSRSGRGRRARTGAEVDALPDRPPHVPGPRRRARHRA